MCRRTALSILLLTLSAPGTGFAGPPTRIEVLVEVEESGAAGELWLELLAKRSSREVVARAAAARRTATPAERAWIELVRSRRAGWEARTGALAEPFQPVAIPARVRVVVGNRGGEDAWTHDPTTIAFDVARLEREYGSALAAENGARIDRFFAHEFAHLLQKAWLPSHPQPMSSPFELAELEMWTEGLGNWYSLSERWRATAGGPSAAARTALERLAPVLVGRMSDLACATPEASQKLRSDLSNGPFDHKWGALPVALWLELEVARSGSTLREFVQGGVASVGDLARRHLPANLATLLDDARRRSRSCG